MQDKRCGWCIYYNLYNYCCTKNWNNLEEEYKIEERDRKRPDDCCDDFEEADDE